MNAFPKLSNTIKYIAHKIDYLLSNIKIKQGRPNKYSYELLLTGIVYKLKTGVPWKLIPYYYGSGSNLHRLMSILSNNNIFKNMWNNFISKCINYNDLIVDCSLIKSPIGKINGYTNKLFKNQAYSKVSLICNENKLPISLKVVEGSLHDSMVLQYNINDIVSNNINICNKNLIADRGYYDNKTFILCNKHKLNAYICRKKQSLFEHRNKFINRINNNTNKNRVKIEHMFATLKQNKSIALNYSKKN